MRFKAQRTRSSWTSFILGSVAVPLAAGLPPSPSLLAKSRASEAQHTRRTLPPAYMPYDRKSRCSGSMNPRSGNRRKRGGRRHRSCIPDICAWLPSFPFRISGAPPPGVKPIGQVVTHETNESIKGTYIIDPDKMNEGASTCSKTWRFRPSLHLQGLQTTCSSLSRGIKLRMVKDFTSYLTITWRTLLSLFTSGTMPLLKCLLEKTGLASNAPRPFMPKAYEDLYPSAKF